MPIRGLLQFVLLIALVLAPICGMSGRAMAMPTPDGAQAPQHHGIAADAEHCAEMDGQQDDDSSDRGSDTECRMMGCAGVLTPTTRLAETAFTTSSPRRMLVAVAAPGLNPGAEPPPPRLS
jgi:hypothetical protein